MKNIVYRPMDPGETKAVCELVKKVFNEFVAPDYSEQGIEAFFSFANADAMDQRLQSGGIVLVAMQADQLVGMVEFFPPDRIAMLFVSAQQQGIAKQLLSRMINKACSANPGLSKLTVHSSPFAESIYLKMGFHKVGNVTTDNGITYIPMELTL